MKVSVTQEVHCPATQSFSWESTQNLTGTSNTKWRERGGRSVGMRAQFAHVCAGMGGINCETHTHERPTAHAHTCTRRGQRARRTSCSFLHSKGDFKGFMNNAALHGTGARGGLESQLWSYQEKASSSQDVQHETGTRLAEKTPTNSTGVVAYVQGLAKWIFKTKMKTLSREVCDLLGKSTEGLCYHGMDARFMHRNTRARTHSRPGRHTVVGTFSCTTSVCPLVIAGSALRNPPRVWRRGPSLC